jgi:long-chain acyl-CoA synthetase
MPTITCSAPSAAHYAAVDKAVASQQGRPTSKPEAPPSPALTCCADLLEASAQRQPQSTAFRIGSHELTYAELQDDSCAFAAYLHDVLQMRPGEQLAIMLPACLSLPTAMFGAWQTGIVTLPLSHELNPEALLARLRECDVSAIVIHEQCLKALEQIIYDSRIQHIVITRDNDLYGKTRERLRGALNRLHIHPHEHDLQQAVEWRSAMQLGRKQAWLPRPQHPDNPALLQFTSGTSTTPRPVMLTHRNLLSSAQQLSSSLDNLIDWRECTWVNTRLPLQAPEITAGWLAPLLRGASVALSTSEPRQLRREQARYKKRVLLMPGETLHQWLAQNAPRHGELKSLAATIAYGSGISQDLIAQWRELTDTPLLNAYYLAEASGICTLGVCNETYAHNDLGHPLPGLECSLRDEVGGSVTPGSIGELWLRGPQVMHGYWAHRKQSGSLLVGDGWLRTGDMVRLDSNDRMIRLGRRGDVIFGRDGQAYPEGTEQVLNGHPAVIESACIRSVLTGTLSGFRAIVVVRNGIVVTEHELIDWCRERLCACAVPVSVAFRSSLPRSESGELLRRELRGADDNRTA